MQKNRLGNFPTRFIIEPIKNSRKAVQTEDKSTIPKRIVLFDAS